jgi:hypothetical protein
MILELKQIEYSFIRKKLGLKKADEQKYRCNFYIDPHKDQRPYHKRFDLGGCTDGGKIEAFINNKEICDIFKCYFKNVSFGVYAYKGQGYYYIYPKYVKHIFEKNDNKHPNYFNDFYNGTITYKHYYKQGINGIGTTEIIRDILEHCYFIERIINNVREDTRKDIQSIINNKLERLFL